MNCCVPDLCDFPALEGRSTACRNHSVLLQLPFTKKRKKGAKLFEELLGFWCFFFFLIKESTKDKGQEGESYVRATHT